MRLSQERGNPGHLDPTARRSQRSGRAGVPATSGPTTALAAPWFVGAALGLDVRSTFCVGDEPLLVARLRAGDQAYLIGPYEELLAVLRRDRPSPGAGTGPRPLDHPVTAAE